MTTTFNHVSDVMQNAGLFLYINHDSCELSDNSLAIQLLIEHTFESFRSVCSDVGTQAFAKTIDEFTAVRSHRLKLLNSVAVHLIIFPRASIHCEAGVCN